MTKLSRQEQNKRNYRILSFVSEQNGQDFHYVPRKEIQEHMKEIEDVRRTNERLEKLWHPVRMLDYNNLDHEYHITLKGEIWILFYKNGYKEHEEVWNMSLGELNKYYEA